MRWVRWHHGTATDPKWRAIARRSGQRLTDVIAVWAMVLEAASEAEERGTLDGFDAEVTAAALDLDTDQVEQILEAMQGKVIDGRRLTGWEKRNPKREDSSAERVRRHRERKRQQRQPETPTVTPETEGVTQCNASVTPGNAPEEDGDTERDTSIHPSSSAGGGARLSVVEGGVSPPGDREDQISAVIREANAAMASNPAIDQRRLRPIPVGHGSRQAVADWIEAGIALDLIREVVRDRAGSYQPDAHHRQISTMQYFDGAVREAAERARATTEGETHDDHSRRPATATRRATPRPTVAALGAGDPSRRSGWVYE